MDEYRDSEEIMSGLRLRRGWLYATILMFLVDFLMNGIRSLVWFLLLYKFTYQKYGTKLLTFLIFCKILGLALISIVVPLYLFCPSIWPEPIDLASIGGLSLLGFFIFLVYFVTTIIWLRLSFKLRKINVRLGFKLCSEAQTVKDALHVSH